MPAAPHTPPALDAITAAWGDAECAACLKAIHRTKVNTYRRGGGHDAHAKHGRERFRTTFRHMVRSGCGVGPRTLGVVVAAAAAVGDARLHAEAVRIMTTNAIAKDARYYASELQLLRKAQQQQRRDAPVFARLREILAAMAADGVALDAAHHTVVVSLLNDSQSLAHRALPYYLIVTDTEAAAREGQPTVRSAEERYRSNNGTHSGGMTYPLHHQAWRACQTPADVHMLWARSASTLDTDLMCLTAGMRAAARVGQPALVEQMLRGAPRHAGRLGVEYHQIMMDAYKRCGAFEEMADQMRRVYEASLLPCASCFDTFIRGCLDRALAPGDPYVAAATDAFREADLLHLTDAQMLYSSLVEVYACVGDVEGAAWLQEVMEGRGVRPSRRWTQAVSQLRFANAARA